MLKKMALIAGSLSVLATATGCCGIPCGLPNCCWTNAAINGLSLIRDLFDYTIAI
ncbi:MAG: hypothetical protein GXY44_05460 [Phycisphaerales bacterium]|nr:hypothetical protein [Phycisphaerales bacterium]